MVVRPSFADFEEGVNEMRSLDWMALREKKEARDRE
jgi:hypothetical protein